MRASRSSSYSDFGSSTTGAATAALTLTAECRAQTTSPRARTFGRGCDGSMVRHAAGPCNSRSTQSGWKAAVQRLRVHCTAWPRSPQSSQRSAARSCARSPTRASWRRCASANPASGIQSAQTACAHFPELSAVGAQPPASASPLERSVATLRAGAQRAPHGSSAWASSGPTKQIMHARFFLDAPRVPMATHASHCHAAPSAGSAGMP
mmetsp:Transcript_14181/g.49332  ORF Transcript_14181/g.49332 Transcript_14181/m.49332 type:complete len:208 (+) Transcript_14181:649-1272(+)